MNDTYEEKENMKAQMMNNRPISAVPPKIQHQDEAVVEVSSTPAFQCLEEVVNFVFCFLKLKLISYFFMKLFQKGKLTGTQVAQLKAKYIELHSTLKKYVMFILNLFL